MRRSAGTQGAAGVSGDLRTMVKKRSQMVWPNDPNLKIPWHWEDDSVWNSESRKSRQRKSKEDRIKRKRD